MSEKFDGIQWECKKCHYRGMRFMDIEYGNEITIVCKCGHKNEIKIER